MVKVLVLVVEITLVSTKNVSLFWVGKFSEERALG